MPYFKWRLCNFAGGSTAVKPSAKIYMILDPNKWDPDDGDWAAGEFTVGARDFTDISVSCGFRPTLVMMVCYRPRNHNLTNDADFGARGGGMSFGVVGHTTGGADPWLSGTTYDSGDLAKRNGVLYASNTNGNIGNTPPHAEWDIVQPDVQYTGSMKFQQGFDLGVGYKTWREDQALNVVSGRSSDGGPYDILTLELGTFDASGFTLSVVENLYDQSDQVFWIALSGNISCGTMEAGDTSIDDYHDTPGAAMFTGTKSLIGDTFKSGYWDHMVGFASADGQMSRWGGGKPGSWNFTTEHWRDSECIIHGTSADTSGFVGATVDQLAFVSAFRAGGIDLQWPVFDNKLWRIGYILFPDGEVDWLETNWNKRPDAVGTNTELTRLDPKVILMTWTNYFFNSSDPNPLNNPHSPDNFGFGGGASLGWFIYPFEEQGWGIHTYANSRQEFGHYSNSNTARERVCVGAGAGANSNPPAPWQHGINVLPNPKIVGINYRYGERHAQVKRFHRNPSDVYVPEPP